MDIVPIERSHLADLTRIAGDARVAATCRIPHPLPGGYVDNLWRESMAVEIPGTHLRPQYHFAITYQCCTVGLISLTQIKPGNRSGQLVYWIDPEFWGRGLATAAVALLLEKAQSELKLDRVSTGVWAQNPASRKVLERNGFEWVDTLEDGASFGSKFVEKRICLYHKQVRTRAKLLSQT
ncbi:MAG: GNAT family N-acetyltransferase [Bacteroidota bacterium]